MNSEGISACIPARNEENTIAQTINSVLNQTYKGDIEVIVCANACTDTTEDIVSQILEKDSRVRLITSEPGKPNAWNRLIRESRYTLNAFMDGDVVIHPEAFFHLQKTIKSNSEYIAAIGNRIVIIDTSTWLSRLLSNTNKSLVLDEYPGGDHISGGFYLLDKGKFIKRMKEKGYDSMPRNIISEDLWVAFVLKDIVGNKLISRYIGYDPNSKFYFRSPNILETYATIKRIYTGQLQLENEHSNLGVHFQERPSMIPKGTLKEKLKRKYTQWKELDGVDKKIIKPFLYVLIGASNRVIHRFALMKAKLEYKKGKSINMWKPAKSTKRTYSLKKIISRTSSDTSEKFFFF